MLRPLRHTLLLLLLLLYPLLINCSRPRPHILSKRNPTYSPISSSSSLSQLSQLTNLDQNLDYQDPTSLLSQILIPRAVGSKNLTKVQDLIVKRFEQLNWVSTLSLFEAL